MEKRNHLAENQLLIARENTRHITILVYYRNDILTDFDID